MMNCLFREWYGKTLEEKLRGLKMKRVDFWSKAIAVGDPDWLAWKESWQMRIEMLPYYQYRASALLYRKKSVKLWE
jgi:hypothetical protein